mmetsp:Transcript_10486/g.7826  ORF Transcript_10486/g.7826 Transcript_10486/m.7826 type:complete len:112 (-) Transcript_10486:59-394(-)
MQAKWLSLQLDAVICPTSYHCAYKHSNSTLLSSFVDYPSFWNVLNFPAGVVPVTEVLPGEDSGYKDSLEDKWTRVIRDDMEGSAGMPIGVQVVAWGFQDEKALAVMKDIDA